MSSPAFHMNACVPLRTLRHPTTMFELLTAAAQLDGGLPPVGGISMNSPLGSQMHARSELVDVR